jgi:streptogramin lyase
VRIASACAATPSEGLPSKATHIGASDASPTPVHLATVTPATAAPTAAVYIWEDSNGDLWVSEWNGGQVSHYSPASKQWKRVEAAGCEPDDYAVYVDEQDIVWLTDFGANDRRTAAPWADR